MELRKKLANIKIITDSTCDIPEELAKELDIIIVPLKVYMDDEEFTSGIDLNSEEFYKKMPDLKDTPSTNPPSPAVFFEAYEDAINEADSIISIHISRKLSLTLEAAKQARDMLPHIDIRLFDSETTGSTLALLIILAVQAIRENKTIDEVCSIINNAIKRVKVVGFPQTLKYLIKGGRIGRARGLVGRLFGRLPILTVTEGETSSITTVQGTENAMIYLIDYLREEGLNKESIIALTHGNLPDFADEFLKKIKENFGCEPIFVGLVGPVVGAHLGPGSIFFSYVKNE
ncbi:MAG: DegV family protein [Asgard group archaeon]|nr:DegV family protein [Asgard group archaeon]